MDWERKSIRIGAVVISCAIVLRLLGGGGLNAMVKALTSPEAVAVMLFLETGRVVRPSAAEEPTVQTEATEPDQTTDPTQPEPSEETTQPMDHTQVLAAFSPEDASLVKVNNVCGYETDLAACLTQALSWDLTEDAPAVLILHSHGTESYENTEGYTESSAYRSRDTAYNVVSVGDRLVQVLEAGGIQAVHDRQLHDSPSYSDSYNNARKSIAWYLEQYPSIRLVLDIHRDAVEDSDGDQLKFTADVDGQTAARLMLVVGTDASGLSHPHWPENMSLAVKLHAQLEKNVPGICRPISFRSQRFNQDLSPGALIVEIGAAGNTRQEALLAAECLGQAIIDLSKGSTTEG